MKLLTALLGSLIALPLAAQTLDDCRNLQHHGKLAEAQTCYAKLAASSNPYLRAEGLWGIERYQEANDQFRDLVKQNPKNANYRVRWGRLFMERFNGEEAHALFDEALKIDKDNAQAYLAIAVVESEDFSKHAVEAAQKAADLDPKLFEAHEQLAYLALEDNNEELAAKEADKALAISGEALDAMAIHASIDFLHDKNDTPWTDRILKINPAYGEAYSTAGALLRHQPALRRGRSGLPQSARTESASMGSARAVGRESHAPGRRPGSPPAAGTVLQRELQELRDRQFSAPARQVQRLRHV